MFLRLYSTSPRSADGCIRMVGLMLNRSPSSARIVDMYSMSVRMAVALRAPPTVTLLIETPPPVKSVQYAVPAASVPALSAYGLVWCAVLQLASPSMPFCDAVDDHAPEASNRSRIWYSGHIRTWYA